MNGSEVIDEATSTQAKAPEVLDARSLTAHGFYLRVKGLLDFCFALLLLLLTLPLIFFAICLVTLTSRGPALYRQTRLGKEGRPFTIYKIRTMTQDAEKNGACWSLPGDSRVTRVGRWLRATHLDELPQLWNVLRGDMSLVGPRPERPEFVPHLEQALPHYRTRLDVRPGVTGLAQVQLPPDTDLESVRLKLAYDLYYVGHAGFWLDLRIGWATGLCMAGLSFRLARSLFGFPSKKAVADGYLRLPGVAAAGEIRFADSDPNLPLGFPLPASETGSSEAPAGAVAN